MKIVARAIALMIGAGPPYDSGMFASFICMIEYLLQAPGVPGAIMASLGLLRHIPKLHRG